MSDETPTVETPAEAPPKKKRGRPFGRVTANVPAPQFTDAQFAQLIQAFTASRQDGVGIGKDELAEILASTAKTSAEAMQKAMRPENTDHPGISALSYPEGDVKRPRPVLPFELWWNAYPMHMFPETEHWRELELACELKPGEYTVLRKDGSKMILSIVAVKNADGKITRQDVRFTETREDKWLTPPKMVTLYQVVHQDIPLRQAFMEGMNEYFTLVFGGKAVA